MAHYMMRFYVEDQLVSFGGVDGDFPVNAWAHSVFGYAYNEAHRVAKEKNSYVQWTADRVGTHRICSRCGESFPRDEEFSLLGYRQCEACDKEMFHAVGMGKPWPAPDKKG